MARVCFFEQRPNYASDNAAYRAIEDKQRIKELDRENRELRQANEILKKASAYFAVAERAIDILGAYRANDQFHPRSQGPVWHRAYM